MCNHFWNINKNRGRQIGSKSLHHWGKPIVRLLILLITSNVFCNRSIANHRCRHAKFIRAIAKTENECARDMMHELTLQIHDPNSEKGTILAPQKIKKCAAIIIISVSSWRAQKWAHFANALSKTQKLGPVFWAQKKCASAKILINQVAIRCATGRSSVFEKILKMVLFFHFKTGNKFERGDDRGCAKDMFLNRSNKRVCNCCVIIPNKYNWTKIANYRFPCVCHSVWDHSAGTKKKYVSLLITCATNTSKPWNQA